MERGLLQSISQTKLSDAEFLFQNERYSNAYYLFGYAAEIAIKARIAVRFRPETIPDKNFVNAVYSHNLNSLIGLAGLLEDLNSARKASLEFDSHWSTVSDWNESVRYDVVDVFLSASMRNAMMDRDNGVFEWLQARW